MNQVLSPERIFIHKSRAAMGPAGEIRGVSSYHLGQAEDDEEAKVALRAIQAVGREYAAGILLSRAGFAGHGTFSVVQRTDAEQETALICDFKILPEPNQNVVHLEGAFGPRLMRPIWQLPQTWTERNGGERRSYLDELELSLPFNAQVDLPADQAVHIGCWTLEVTCRRNVDQLSIRRRLSFDPTDAMEAEGFAVLETLARRLPTVGLSFSPLSRGIAYQASGLRLNWPYEIDDLLQRSEETDAADLRVELAAVRFHEIDGVAQPDVFYRPGLGFRFATSNGGRISIDMNGAAQVQPKADPQSRHVLAAILNPMLSAGCYLKGLLPVHGSAVEKEGEALIFVGQSGAGKSTYCAGLARRGWRPVADDLSAIETRGATPTVFPGIKRIRLCEDSQSSFAYAGRGEPRALDGKAGVEADAAWAIAGLPIRAIVFLELPADEDRHELIPLAAADAAARLCENMRERDLLTAMDIARDIELRALELTPRIACYRLVRPHRFDCFDRAEALAEAAWGRAGYTAS